MYSRIDGNKRKALLVLIPSLLLFWLTHSIPIEKIILDLESKQDEPLRIAIIGAGIGGASTAYFIHQELSRIETSHNVHIFEKDTRIGGRIRSFAIQEQLGANDSQNDKLETLILTDDYTNNDGFNSKNIKTTTFELGAGAWSKVNYYLEKMAQELEIDLTRQNLDRADSKTSYIYEGPGRDGYVWKLGDSFNFTIIKLAAQMEEFKLHLYDNYLAFRPEECQGSPLVWDSVEEWSNVANIGEYTKVNIGHYLESHGIDKRFIKENVDPVLRVIYDQSSSINAFAGLVSLISSDNSARPLDGLQSFVSRMIEKSESRVHLNTKVYSIQYMLNEFNQSGGYRLRYTDNCLTTSPTDIEQDFDIVVIATPLEFANINFVNFKIPEMIKRKYTRKTTSFVRSPGLNQEYFKFETDFVLTNDHSSDNQVDFFFIGRVHTFQNGDKLYKVFSKHTLAQNGGLEKWFVRGILLKEQEWEYAFPILDPLESSGHDNPSTYQHIKLHDNLYYINAIENVAVAMEASVMTAHNIALILSNTGKGLSTKLASPHSMIDDAKSNRINHSIQTLGMNIVLALGFLKGILMVICLIISGIMELKARGEFHMLACLLLMTSILNYGIEKLIIAMFRPDFLKMTPLHVHPILIVSDIFSAILMALGSTLCDSILPASAIIRVVWNSNWTIYPVYIVGFILTWRIYPLITVMLAVLSRFLGHSIEPYPSLCKPFVPIEPLIMLSQIFIIFLVKDRLRANRNLCKLGIGCIMFSCIYLILNVLPNPEGFVFEHQTGFSFLLEPIKLNVPHRVITFVIGVVLATSLLVSVRQCLRGSKRNDPKLPILSEVKQALGIWLILIGAFQNQGSIIVPAIYLIIIGIFNLI